jgi:shikimate kinase
MIENREIVNILIVSLDQKFGEAVSSMLASDLDMFFVDCRKMIIYDLEDPRAVLEKCGVEYLKKRERKVLKNCGEYQNTVVNVDGGLFMNNADIFTKSCIVYLKLNQKAVKHTINSVEYENLDKFIEENSDISIFIDKKSTIKTIEKIKQRLGELL